MNKKSKPANQNQFSFTFNGKKILSGYDIQSKNWITELDFFIDVKPQTVDLTNTDQINSFLEEYQKRLEERRDKEIKQIEFEEKKFFQDQRDEKWKIIKKTFSNVLFLLRNRYWLPGFRGRLIFTYVSGKLVGVTKVDLDADVRTIINKTDRFYTELHSISVQYTEEKFQLLVRSLLQSLYRIGIFCAVCFSLGIETHSVINSIEEINTYDLLDGIYFGGSSLFLLIISKNVRNLRNWFGKLLLTFAFNRALKHSLSFSK